MAIIRLLDRTRAYLHAVIDNDSRRILSWTLEERLASSGTCRILREAVTGRKRSFRVILHSAFEGHASDEIYLGTGDEVTVELAAARINARNEWISENRTARCGVCVGVTGSEALLLQRPCSKML